jgi:hypothetical protein
LIDCQDSAGCPVGTGSVPAEIGGLRIAGDKLTLEWQPAGDAGSYDLLWGRLDELRADGGLGRSECLAWRVVDPFYAVAEQPPAGSAWYYLVRGKADPCLLGSWGDANRDLAVLTCP